MKLTAVFFATAGSLAAVLAQQYVVWSVYPRRCDLLKFCAASGYTVSGGLPAFPCISGAFAITEYDSPACGTCWELTYNNTSINLLAIDTVNALMQGEDEKVGFIYATATQVDASACGGY
ncbi:uncharacterized protein LAESUDRAFT_716784 [Laetiporus sulphureus 93-53]|uniref:Cerato-platanin n=1 Tax=Laetiporus sulphureus 93-53 TaxID=1314785 RepID=A0A165CCU2_9APHY|nr:uncharacterized protein LAESUDRAFT_716784 [Laetiporus sulphureus 93-53]KZT02579.1 hypothetical protein LAESUDRAFT_716784 [Laetiporus sulphureus 93-53]